MNYLAHSLFIFLFHLSGFTQTNTYTVKSGENPSEVLPKKIRYLNADFIDGHLAFSMSKISKVFKFNLDLYTNMLVFTNEKNDTLFIKDDKAVRYLFLGSEKYYHDILKGYFKILATDTTHTLASQVLLVKSSKKKIDEGYGGSTNGTSATVSVSKNVDMIFERVTQYYLISRNGEIFNTTKSGFTKLFKGKEDLIKSYIKQNNVSLKREEGISNLFNYCLSLFQNR